jgi:outer membrane biosynthesis protein TonB
MSAGPKQPVFLRIMKNGKPLEMKQYSGQQIVIGREGKVDLIVNDQSVSPIHAMIEEREEGRYFLCDLGSQAGTSLNGYKIVDEAINSGSEFQLGAVTLEFHIGVPRPKSAPIAAPIPQPAPVAPKKVEIPKPPPVATPAPVSRPAPVIASGAAMGFEITSKLPQKPQKVPGTFSGTFAPTSSARIDETLKPSRGNTVEIVLVWKDRVLNTYHFLKKGVVKVGSHPDNDIILPVFGSVRIAHPIIKIDASTIVYLTSEMTGELVREKGSFTIDELKRSGEITTSGTGFKYTLQQSEVLKISMGEGVKLVIRYVAQAPESHLLPFLNIPMNHLTALVVGLMAMTLFLFYTFLYSPPPPDKDETIEPPRKAQFIYKRRAEELNETKEAQSSAKETIKDKAVANERGEEGAAQEAKANNSKSQKQKLTADKASKENNVQRAKNKTASSAKSAAKDVTKSGVLSVFGTKGVQDQLNKAYQGSGNVAGLSKSATGQGAEASGTSEKPGSGLREVGKGGSGTATVGIAGVNTKGRGGGLSGYGTAGLGAKKNASIIAGGDDETFSGSIDKEAIRRVVQANIKQIRACYERGLNKDPSLYGKLVIQWTIGAGGVVTAAGIKSSTIESAEVASCAVARLRSWKFPEPPAGEVADVSYPFVFQAQD